MMSERRPGTAGRASLSPETVRIPVAGGMLSGQLFTTPATSHAPAIVMDSELAGSQDPETQTAARALAEQGWVVLVFDHAGFGNSGGARGQLRWKRQIEHLAQVWWWLRKRIGIDGNRVGIWAHGLGGWRARMLAETADDIPALVLHAPVWRQRDWLLQPALGLSLLQEAGYFFGSEPDPLSQPGWTLAWLELLRAPLPAPKRLSDIPLLLWHPPDASPSDRRFAALGHQARCESLPLPTKSPSALTVAGEGAVDPVIRETDAFFRQYL